MVAGFLALWVGIIYVLVLWVVGFEWFVLVMVCLDFCGLCVFVFDLWSSIIGVVFGDVVLWFVGSLGLLLRFGIDCRFAGSRDCGVWFGMLGDLGLGFGMLFSWLGSNLCWFADVGLNACGFTSVHLVCL